MSKGISIYFGLDYTLEKNLEYLEIAYNHGFREVFTSLHIPEVDYTNLLREFCLLVDKASSLGMDITADISPRVFDFIGISDDYEYFKRLGVKSIRLDFGYDINKIVKLSNNSYGLGVDLNASTITIDELKSLKKLGANFNNIKCTHNYYPKKYTALGEDYFLKQNRMLKEYNLKISAFVPSNNQKRGPIYDGLPTLERHRCEKVWNSWNHLIALGVDDIYFSDAYCSIEEMKSVSKLKEDYITLRVKTDKNITEKERLILFGNIHCNRVDYSDIVIRSTTSRGKDIHPRKNDSYSYSEGMVTIDNNLYKRYCGEVQIFIRDVKVDERSNIVCEVIKEDLYLLKYIKENVKFKFLEV